MLVNCSNCSKEFEKSRKAYNQYIKHGYRFFCSKICQGKAKSSSMEYTCKCCGKKVTRSESKISGSIYCSRSCAVTNNNKGISRALKDGMSIYRRKALEYYLNECAICRYNTIEVLEVHHRDGNRKNNNINNLMILCPTHHKEYDLGIRK